jgi:hypothetical protein
MTVEDMFLLDDLRSLEIPWIDELVDAVSSHAGVRRVWTVLMSWGPQGEDADEVTSLGNGVPGLAREAEKYRRLSRLLHGQRR